MPLSCRHFAFLESDFKGTSLCSQRPRGRLTSRNRSAIRIASHREHPRLLRIVPPGLSAIRQLIWCDPVNSCSSLFLFLSLFLSFEDRLSSSRGRYRRRLIKLIFAGRDRIIMIRRELPLTTDASPAEPVAN